ncbi:MAG: hypothetical protein CSA19_00105 [Deltaproteobacteria bacterium]|nr:MAG: hypothetical protein CSA19_00105 [Deltaproteobacteria bacterium]
MRGLSKKLSLPLWEITKKHDDDVAEGIKEEDEATYYRENGFDLTEPFLHSQEEINEQMFVSEYGEEAYHLLREKGVFYPDMEEYFTRINNNTYQYYPEGKKHYSVLNIEEDVSRTDLSDDFCQSCDSCVNPEDVAPWKRTFKTASKKIECFLGNLEKKGIDPMPSWNEEEHVEVPAGRFKFITGRHAQHTQTSTLNNVMLLDIMKENYVWINDAEARKLGIVQGDLVEITSSVGSVRIKAYPTPKIIPETIFYIHGFGAESDGFTFAHRNGASDNEIIEGNIEPVFGSSIMHETIVTVKKV